MIEVKVIDEAKKRNLHIIYAKKIEEWFKNKDQKDFAKRITKEILNEMKKFQVTKDDIEKLIKETFKEPEWIIIYPENKLVAGMIHKLVYA
jgi:DNA-binding transcriptional regulator YhcF (GntR family)